MAEVHIAIPELTEKARFECRCIGENAKDTLIKLLKEKADAIENYQKTQVPMFPELSEPALGRAKMLRELADKIRDIPTCTER